MKQSQKNWFREIFSINERKNSTIILLLLIFSGLGIYGFIVTKTFDKTLAQIIIWGMGITGGVNSLSSIFGGGNNSGYSSYGYGNNGTDIYGSNNNLGTLDTMSNTNQPIDNTQSINNTTTTTP